MDSEHYITLKDLSTTYEVEFEFVQSLKDYGLLRIMLEDGEECISKEELADTERMIRLHYELDINLAGLEAIHHLLERVREMQKELNQLRNRLGTF